MRLTKAQKSVLARAGLHDPEPIGVLDRREQKVADRLVEMGALRLAEEPRAFASRQYVITDFGRRLHADADAEQVLHDLSAARQALKERGN